MNGVARPIDRPPQCDLGETAFKDWLRRLVTGVAELRAFDAGEIDAVMDHVSGSAVLLPEAHGQRQGSARIALHVLDALPSKACVLDARGTVVMANQAWHTYAALPGAGLRVREQGNFFVACRNAPEPERRHAEAVAVGLRQVLAGTRHSFRHRYVCEDREGRSIYSLTIAAVADGGVVHAVITHAARGANTRLPALRRSRITLAAAEPRIDNRLLAALSVREYARLASCLEPVTLTYGEVLYEPGQRMRHVYFPGVCLVSLLTLVEGHRALEAGLVGREGMIGARLAIGAATSPVRALVLGTGTALRMKAAHFSREFRRSLALQRALLRFNDDLMIQISQTAACNRFHVVEARLARWLLMTAERMERSDFHLTHAFLADMLGVRREGVTEAAGALQRRRLIHYRRGAITILDQPGLEAASCSCYGHLRLMKQGHAATA